MASSEQRTRSDQPIRSIRTKTLDACPLDRCKRNTQRTWVMISWDLLKPSRAELSPRVSRPRISR